MNLNRSTTHILYRIVILFCIFLLSCFLNACATTTPLIQAASRGDITTIDALLTSGTNIDERGACDGSPYNYETPLTCAICNGRIETINFLLDKGSDIDSTFSVDTPLQTAIRVKKPHIVKLLLDRGANPNIEKPLGDAAFYGDIESMNLLIAKGADIDTTIEDLKTYYDSWLPGHNKKLDAAIRLLEKQKPRPVVTVQTPTPVLPQQTITKEDIATIVQAAVEKAGKVKTRPTIAASPGLARFQLTSDERIMGDNDLAVIIGIEGYSSLPKSDYSYDDARLVKDYVKALGFRERNIELITDEKATLSGIAKTVEIWLRNKAKEDSRIFVYYSGHGAPDPATGEAYLVPYDGDPNYLSVTGYPLKKLYSKLGQLQVKEVIVILDSCFSGAGGRSVLAKGARPLVMVTGITTIPPNMAVLTATQGNQISTSAPEKGHGIFTYYFLKALKDGKRNIREIYGYIKPLVEDEAKQLNVQQRPCLKPALENLTGRFNLRK